MGSLKRENYCLSYFSTTRLTPSPPLSTCSSLMEATALFFDASAWGLFKLSTDSLAVKNNLKPFPRDKNLTFGLVWPRLISKLIGCFPSALFISASVVVLGSVAAFPFMFLPVISCGKTKTFGAAVANGSNEEPKRTYKSARLNPDRKLIE